MSVTTSALKNYARRGFIFYAGHALFIRLFHENRTLSMRCTWIPIFHWYRTFPSHSFKELFVSFFWKIMEIVWKDSKILNSFCSFIVFYISWRETILNCLLICPLLSRNNHLFLFLQSMFHCELVPLTLKEKPFLIDFLATIWGAFLFQLNRDWSRIIWPELTSASTLCIAYTAMTMFVGKLTNLCRTVWHKLFQISMRTQVPITIFILK